MEDELRAFVATARAVADSDDTWTLHGFLAKHGEALLAAYETHARIEELLLDAFEEGYLRCMRECQRQIAPAGWAIHWEKSATLKMLRSAQAKEKPND